MLLVLDATVGQNALSQVEIFSKTAGVTGLVMTKLDGTARGGILVALAEKYGCRCISSASARASTISRRSPRGISRARSPGSIVDSRPCAPESVHDIAAVIEAEAPNDNETRKTPARPAHPLFKLATELGPLVVFFVANSQVRICSSPTGAFMVAVLAAMVASYVVTRHVPLMALVTAVIVIVFGTLTLVLHDETFIKVKPTIIYVLFGGDCSAAACCSAARSSPSLFDQMFNLTAGLAHADLRWALFFFAMAVLNEIVWRTQTTDFWVGFKAFGVIPLTMVFAAPQMPLINK